MHHGILMSPVPFEVEIFQDYQLKVRIIVKGKKWTIEHPTTMKQLSFKSNLQHKHLNAFSHNTYQMVVH